MSRAFRVRLLHVFADCQLLTACIPTECMFREFSEQEWEHWRTLNRPFNSCPYIVDGTYVFLKKPSDRSIAKRFVLALLVSLEPDGC